MVFWEKFTKQANNPEVSNEETSPAVTIHNGEEHSDNITNRSDDDFNSPWFALAKKPLESRAQIIAFFVFLVGLIACGVILLLGIPALQDEQAIRFASVTEDLLHKFQLSVNGYIETALWVHQACRERDTTHQQFRALYEYLLLTGVELQAVSFAMNVTHDERPALEATTRAYLKNDYPNVTYGGFSGYEIGNTTGEAAPGPRSNSSFYFPVHYLQPLENVKNLAAIDFDIYTSPPRREAIDQALSTGKPALSKPLKLIAETQVGAEPAANSVILFHPGTTVSTAPDEGPRDLAVLAIRIPELLLHMSGFQREGGVYLYIFDSTDAGVEPAFIGGAYFEQCQANVHASSVETMTFTRELEMSEVLEMHANFRYEESIPVASRQWSVVVIAPQGSFEPDRPFTVFGSVMVFVACTSLSLWIWTSSRRVAKLNAVRSMAEAEKAQIMVDNAKRAAMNERELNDFIAHEVRNPLAAAISACSFVSVSVNEAEPLVDPSTRQSVREDVGIIDNSLQFVNDLLRNMLDMHRASSNQLQIEVSHVDLLQDVLQPVASMIYSRGDNYEVLLDCQPHTVVMSDRLRLKQIMLNLGRNAAKFVSKGFVRLRVDVVDGIVNLMVEDSGPGIPEEKRKRLFAKFQESLDSLNQGTGIGLCLCKKLVELMGGQIWLDEDYDSGVEGCPGTRIVLSLNVAQVPLESLDLSSHSEKHDLGAPSIQKDEDSGTTTGLGELPSGLSVLFVDDAFVLRKLFGRTVKRIAPDWKVEEAASGETALQIVETREFDLIFMDQYMASADKQLLGTETVRVMRARGVKSVICGLSANDLETAFLNAGADAFMIKPFPCKAEELTPELLSILSKRSS